ncbi:MAG: hypothetical protein U0Q16_21285 [Bryobacteraceae bacterium]
MIRRAALLCAAVSAFAQPPVSPTPETVGRARGEDAGGYNIVHSFETGYRFHTVDGNEQNYRAGVNYGNGIRLLGSQLTVNSKDGHGHWFDEIVLTTQGLGNDPYQYVNARAQRNRLYRYDFTFRIADYFNPGLTTGTAGGHLRDTRRQLQDHDFTLLPSGPAQLLFGYSRNSQNGPGLSTIQLFDSRGDEFPLLANINRRQSEFRLGGQFRFAGMKLLVMRGWERYEETSTDSSARNTGVNTTDQTALASFRRNEPYSGDTPFWRLNLIQDRKNWYSIHGRLHYAASRRAFSLDELASGTDRRGAAAARQVLTGGTGTRPVTTGSFTFSLFPNRYLTVSNHTAFHQIAMDGSNRYQEFNNNTLDFTQILFDYLGIRTIANSTDASVRVSRWLGLQGGYHYSTRRIRSRQGEKFDDGTSDFLRYEQSNTLHAGSAGVRLQPIKPLTISLDGELGRADRPIFTTSERNYHTVGGRAQYRAKNLLLSASSRAQYNTNSASLFVHSAHTRSNSFDASYTVSRAVSFDAGYSKQHVDSLTGLAYFALGRLNTGDRSVYTSNLHAVNLGVRLSFNKRADVYVGYSRVQDTGDGRSAAAAAQVATASALTAFQIAQVFPLSYDSPQARVSVRLHDKIRWNFGYQMYRYDEKFFDPRDYRANTGFTSLTWQF